METLGAIYIIIVIFLIIVAILAFLMPFFVLKIRNEMIKLNNNMDKVIDLLGRVERRLRIEGQITKDRKS